MKTTHLTPAVWLGIAALSVSALAQPPAAAPGRGAAQAQAGGGTMTFNFRGAPLEQVLTYMSETGGFSIVYETPVRGTVDILAAQPVTREEALQLLAFALNKNGFTSVVQGRTIIISSKEDAKKKNLPIRTGSDPESIPNTAEMVIQIIPLRHLDATNAARDLGALLPGSSTLTANVDSNSLVVTDTNINLKQVVTLVNALDTSSDSISTSEVVYLQNADPTEMAQLIMNLYGTANTQQAGGRGGAAGFGGAGGGIANLAAAFGGGAAGGRGGGGRGGAGGARGGGRGGAAATSRNVPVVAVADPRTYAVIISAAKEQMPDILDTVKQLDGNPARKQKVFTYTMENANVTQVETALRNLFPSSTNRTATNNTVDPLEQRARVNAQNSAGTSSQISSGTNSAARGN